MFDHALDAFESMDNGMGEWYGCDFAREKDPLFYHTKVNVVKEVTKTEKAELLRITLEKNTFELWFPKSWIKRVKGETYVWTEGFHQNLKTFAGKRISNVRSTQL